MKKIGFIIFAAALVLGLVVSNIFSFGRISDRFFNISFDFKGVNGSGNLASDVREVSGFKGVDVGGVIHVEITAQKEFSVEVEADDNILPLVTTEVRRGVLHIETEKRVSPSNHIRVRISAPDIDRLEVSGVANVTVNELKNTSLSIDSSGSSRVKVNGETSKINVDVSGASNIDAERLTAENAIVEASGASHVKVNVTGNLRAEAHGASSIQYSGSPNEIVKKASRASTISAKQ